MDKDEQGPSFCDDSQNCKRTKITVGGQRTENRVQWGKGRGTGVLRFHLLSFRVKEGERESSISSLFLCFFFLISSFYLSWWFSLLLWNLCYICSDELTMHFWLSTPSWLLFLALIPRFLSHPLACFYF